MNRSTFKNWNKEFRGIATTIKEVGNGKITRGLIRKITSITVERIDQKLLNAIFDESYDTEIAEYVGEPDYTTYQVPHFYIIWLNDWIEKSDRIGAKHCIIPQEGPSYEYENDHEAIKVLPVASHFIERNDVKYVILVWESGHRYIHGWEVDGLKIIIYKPSKDKDFDLSSISHEIMEIFEKKGGQGLSYPAYAYNTACSPIPK